MARYAEQLEDRQLLTGVVTLSEIDADHFRDWGSNFNQSHGTIFDEEPFDVHGTTVLNGAITRGDVDYVYFDLTAGNVLDLKIEDEAFQWEQGDDFLLTGHASASSAGDAVGKNDDSTGESLNVSIEKGGAGGTGQSNAFITVASSLTAGSATATATATANGHNSGAYASIGAIAQYYSNRSGEYTVTSSSWPSSLTGRGTLDRYDDGRGRFVTRFYPGSASATASVLSDVFVQSTDSETVTSSWTFTPDAFTPVLGIFDAEGNLLLTTQGSLHFEVPETGGYYLAISHNGHWDGANDTGDALGYYRPYTVTMVGEPLGALTLEVAAEFNGFANPIDGGGEDGGNDDEGDDDGSGDLARRFVPRSVVPQAIQVTSDKFGPYLPGVNLQNTFTVKLTGTGTADVSEVTWQIGERTGSASRVSGEQWRFTTNMLDFTAGSRTLSVKAKNSLGQVIQEYQGQIVHTNTLDFELKVDPGSSDDPISVENARFFRDVAAFVKFEGSIDGLPSYYRNDTHVIIGGTDFIVTWQTGGNLLQKFTLERNVGDLPLGFTAVDVRIAALSITRFNDTLEPLHSVAKPAWLNGATPVYNNLTGDYDFANARPKLLEYSASLAKTKVKWLDAALKKLDSYAQLQAVLNIKAPLQITQSVDFSASQLVGEYEILGSGVHRETFTSNTLRFGGLLDPLTLDPQGLSVRLSEPKLLGAATFLDRTITIDLLRKIAPGLPEWLAKARFDLAMKLLGQITIDGGVMLVHGTTGIEFDAAGTFVSLTATPTAEATGTLTAKVAGGFLADFTGSASGVAVLTLNAQAHFSGSVLSPALESARFDASFKLNYRIKVKGTLAKTVTFVDYDSGSEEEGGTADDVFGPYQVLKLSTGRK